ncbi:hypothetical protein B296_00001772 [Ensete ventricosum]|uniref:Reticulon-like protein n=1 Tax=Ensete ventricosum TaxID=4639 RepID=A0A427BAA7_ENSVE|nr:hypothetical protein B296_00001772 [Ensete ventricosum]
MPRVKFDSASDEQPKPTTRSHFHRRRRPLHDRMGGGKGVRCVSVDRYRCCIALPILKRIHGLVVADVLLWRNKHLSAAIVAGATFVWFLFEVVEYHFLALMCHISIAAMLSVLCHFIFSLEQSVSSSCCRDARRMPELVLSEEAIRGLAFFFHAKLSRLTSIADGKDLKLFLSVHELFTPLSAQCNTPHVLLFPQAIASLWVVSVIGSYCSSLTLAYLGKRCADPTLRRTAEEEELHLLTVLASICAGLLCLLALPALYERYEDEVDHLAMRGSEDLKRFYQKLDSRILGKIPRGPVNNAKKSK